MCCTEFDNCSSPLTVKHTMALLHVQEEEVTNAIREQAAARLVCAEPRHAGAPQQTSITDEKVRSDRV